MRTETAPQPDETLVAGRIHLAAIRFITESNQTRLLNTPAKTALKHFTQRHCTQKDLGVFENNCMVRHAWAFLYFFYGEYDDVKHPNLKCTNFRQTHFQTPCLFAKEPPQHKWSASFTAHLGCATCPIASIFVICWLNSSWYKSNNM